jgi:O-antigen ligase
MAAASATRIGGAIAALGLLVLLQAGFRLAADATWIRLLMLAAVALAAWRPWDALLVLAGLGQIIGTAGAVAGAPFSMREILVLAIFTGWAVHAALARSRAVLPPDLSWPLAAATIVVITSLAVELYGQRQLVGPAAFREMLTYTLEHGLLRDRHALRGLNGGLVHLEGLAVFAAAAALCARRPAAAGQAAAMAAAGAAGAAMLNIQRVVVAAQSAVTPFDRLRELLTTVRVNVSYLDVNAAGSYFALMFFPAARQVFRSAGWRRTLWSIATVGIFAAAWLTGSRAAVAAIVAVALLATFLAARWQSWRAPAAAVAIAVCLLAAAAFVMAFPNRVFGAATPVALEIRVQMARISLAMLAAQPLFGVGVGGFHEASEPYLASSTIAAYYTRENAHNNLLQWLAELGMVGFAAFAWLLWRAARRILAAAPGRDDGTLRAGIGAGLLAFVLTAMLGHPLLTPEVNHAFWLMLGIACGAAPLPAGRREPRATRAGGILVIALAVGLLPWRFQGEAAGLQLEHVRYGTSRWETDAEGVRYQTFTGRATLFVPASAQAVEIPLSLDHAADTPVILEIRFRNRLADRLTVTSTAWQTYRLIVGPRPRDPSYLPVEIRVTDDDGQPIRIGRTVAR